MYRCDSHMHTHFSFDGHPSSSVDAICRAALDRGVEEITITDHCDINGEVEAIYAHYEMEAARDEVFAAREAYRGQLIVNWGIDLQMAYDHGDSGVATSKQAVNQMDGVAAAASSIKYYPAILAYLRDGDKILQVAMSFSEGAFDDAALAEIASHITLKIQ